MRIVVTGGAGFIGSHICNRLLGEGHETHVVDNLVTGRIDNLPDGATLHRRDIRDPEIGPLWEKLKPDAVIHLAAQMDVRKSVADPVYDAQVNVLGGLNVLEACRRSGTERIVFASTGGAVYGSPVRFPVDEDAPCFPLSPYGATKLAFEKYLHIYREVHGLQTTILRLANVYGPRQDPHGEAGVVAIFSLRCLSGRPCTIFGDGSKTRDYVFVEDVVDAFLRGLTTDRPGIYNIGRGQEITDRQVYDTVAQACDVSEEPVFANFREGEVERISLSAVRAREALGWTPTTDFATGVATAVAYYRESRAYWREREGTRP